MPQKKAILALFFLLLVPLPLFSEELGEGAADFLATIERHSVSVIVYDIGDSSRILRGKGNGVLYACDPISMKSVIFTNWHVGVGRTQVNIIFQDKTYLTADVIVSNQEPDYAILFVPYAPKDCQHLHARTPKLLESIIVAGFRWMRKGDKEDEQIFFFLKGNISTKPTQRGFIGISAPITIGSSGSGIWAWNGKETFILGIASYVTGHNRNEINPGSGMMVPIIYIREDAMNRIKSVPHCARCEDVKNLMSMQNYQR